MLSRILGTTRGQTGTTRKLEKCNISWSSQHGTPPARETRRTSVDQSGGRHRSENASCGTELDSHRHMQFRTATGEIVDRGFDNEAVGEDSRVEGSV